MSRYDFPYCAVQFLGLLPWAFWYYSSHPILFVVWPMIYMCNRGTPWSLDLVLVLHRIVQSIDADDDCLNIFFQSCYLDDTYETKKSFVLCALTLMQELSV